jgi:hypothetical protein
MNFKLGHLPKQSETNDRSRETEQKRITAKVSVVTVIIEPIILSSLTVRLNIVFRNSNENLEREEKLRENYANKTRCFVVGLNSGLFKHDLTLLSIRLHPGFAMTTSLIVTLCFIWNERKSNIFTGVGTPM